MFYSRQIYTCLVEPMSNYPSKKDKKIDLESTETEVISKRCSTKQLFFPWKIPAKKFIF